MKRNQPGHEEETFEEFTARYNTFLQLDVGRAIPSGWFAARVQCYPEKAAGISRAECTGADNNRVQIREGV